MQNAALFRRALASSLRARTLSRLKSRLHAAASSVQSFGTPLKAPVRLDGRYRGPKMRFNSAGLGQRCFASRVKDMKPHQLDEANKHAQAGKGKIKQGDIKLAGDDHQILVQTSFEEGAQEKMGKALYRLRNALARKDIRVESSEEREERNKQLNKSAEQGRQDVRNTRMKLMQELGRLEKDGELSSDEQHRIAEAIQKATERYIDEIDTTVRSVQNS